MSADQKGAIMGEFSAWHWLIVAVVVVLLFGTNKLPQIARSVGSGLRIFRAELRSGETDARDTSER